MTNYSKLNNYINFTDKFEMNEHVTAHRQAHCYTLNDTDKSLLTYVSRYACRYVGVAYLKVSTMCKFLGKSESTIKRSLCKLGELGIIKKIRTTRLKGGFGANILQIQQFNELSNVNGCTNKNNPSIHCESKHESNTGETKPFYSQSKNIKDIKTSTKHSKPSALNNNLYAKLKALYEARKGSLSNFRVIVGKIYSTIKKLKADATVKLSHVQIESIMYRSLDALLNMTNVKNEMAMLTSIIKNKVQDLIQSVSAPAHTITANRRTELVPDWFYDRNTRNSSNENNTVVEPSLAPTFDFDAEKARILAKIGQL